MIHVLVLFFADTSFCRWILVCPIWKFVNSLSCAETQHWEYLWWFILVLSQARCSVYSVEPITSIYRQMCNLQFYQLVTILPECVHWHQLLFSSSYFEHHQPMLLLSNNFQVIGIDILLRYQSALLQQRLHHRVFGSEFIWICPKFKACIAFISLGFKQLEDEVCHFFQHKVPSQWG